MPPKRFRAAWLFAWAASIVAVVLAVGPNAGSEYDPNLAILTLTVIAVIWYTYFTYRGVHREPPTVLQIGVQGVMHPGIAKISPTIANLSPRSVVARLFLSIHVDDERAPVGEIYRGETLLEIAPHETFHGDQRLDNEIMKPLRDSAGGVDFSRKELRVVFRVEWSDDLRESGSIGPKYWYASRDRPALGQVIAQENIDRLFPTRTRLV